MSSLESEKNPAVVLVREESNSTGPQVDAGKADAALDFLDAHTEFDGLEISEDEHRTIVTKINLHLLPLVIAVTTLLYMDKATLSYASILGLFESTPGNSCDEPEMAGKFLFSLPSPGPFC